MIYKLANKEFKTKGAAIKYVKALKNNNPVGHVFESEEFDVLADLIKKHPDYETDYISVANFKVDINYIYNNICLWVIFPDGSCLDFSPKNCFNHPTNYSKVTKAFRYLVSDQIYNFKKSKLWVAQNPLDNSSGGVIECEITKKLYPWSEIDVDHNFSTGDLFSKLIFDFCQKYNCFKSRDKFDKKKVKVISFKNSRVVEFKEEKWNRRWRRYHKKYANLRCISSVINRSN